MQIIKIYYNQSCSICNCEINYYKKKIKNPLFEWVDINDNIKAYIETKKTKDQLMRRMHA
jgi:predicted DCC family thiol-disulfide oxidoreductase YuxK